MVNNKLSQYQLDSLNSLLQVPEKEFTHLIKNMEYQLNGLGQLPIDESGSIQLTQSLANYPKEMRELFDDIAKSTQKLRDLVARHDAKTDRALQIGTNDLGLKPCKVDSQGFEHYDCISVVDFLDLLTDKAELKSGYHAHFIKAKSQNVVEKIFNAWTFVSLDKCSDDIKLSNSDVFVNVVAIVTSWDIELSRKNVGNFLKRKRESC
ncbi:hypothetical protein [Vibrio parahaemolyticus]|uniref:hypothetical protein n=2 Tax=Vibrio parahaemolyticus TaxID=670 RepID=UPI00047280C4|nr:hypothetical protein [Vibrio parahaemolyticus]EHK0751959.1 hypothetical protein [Vibrio parahaemolyticus]EJE4178999.1 hypothetical protein [Vibrio parahaemolyticus]MCR9783824.1 hypothetical protein [Vibrio parahaemolyticus]MDF4649081.1 hypothetical protein [Vibrio parahaemolyticus]MDG3031285.1 hypothetical protein [Vibrio parahaemolyticus]